uniref:plasmid mobilization protein n=1 Tax=Lactococcus garvieae TaxID=1363 RepID=UPI00359C6BA0
MSELTNLASTKKGKQPNRKEHKQINFRVSESEYLKLKQNASALNISVPAFVKKKAQGARIVAPKMHPEETKEVIRQLAALGNNINQLTKRLHQIEGIDEGAQERIEEDLRLTLKGLRDIWRQLT